MSTVLLMTDAWQPTVLRLVPFSSNNARSPDRSVPGKPPAHHRGFPVLAVTRSPDHKNSSAHSDARSGDRSVASARSDAFAESDALSVCSNASGYTTVTDKTNVTTNPSTAKHSRKYAKKKVPDMHSEMKEAIKFSVQDINDQISSTSSLTSSENKDENRDKLTRVDNTRTRLPKPSLSSPPDARSFYSPVNGVRRSVPLTPGELELQRIRDSYYVEQVQKRKKYKLNVNQLPRSTTPINDHDPDKLNMKQVIAFLQTKTTKDIQKKIVVDKKGVVDENSARSVRSSRVVPEVSSAPSPSPRKIYSKDNVVSLSRSSSDLKGANDKLENLRQIPGCMSVMSTKSSPVVSYGNNQTQKSGKALSTRSGRSGRSYKSNRDRKSDRQRPNKEFKLYRFLAIAPDGQSQGMVSTVSDAVPTIEKSFVTQEFGQSDQNKKILFRKSKERESGTARVLHRHAINRSAFTPPKSDKVPHENGIADDSSVKTIRLPLMNDAEHEALEVDSDNDSTTSATCNSTNQNGSVDERHRSPKKGKSISFDDNVGINTFPNSVSEVTLAKLNGYIDHTDMNSFVRTHKAPGFPRVNITGPKQIRVNVPQESKKMYSQEIVRLTLRQEKSATRVTSYMSDMQGCLSSRRDDNADEYNMAHVTPNGFLENGLESPAFSESSRTHINTVSNNSFIKVRQKLKASNGHSPE